MGNLIKTGLQVSGVQDKIDCANGDLKACSRVAIGTDETDCLAGNADACAKEAMKEAAEIGCAAAVTSAGNPELAVLCGPVVGLVVDFAYPIVKDLMVGIGQGMEAGIMLLIPNAWTARSVFDPGALVGDLWYANDLAVLRQWEAAVQAVQTGWDEGRKYFNLAPAPVSIRTNLLLPAPHEQRPLSPVQSKYTDGAEACLLRWLYAYKSGWKISDHWCWNYDVDGSGTAGVKSSTLPGEVKNAVVWGPPGSDPGAWIGNGPFGLQTYGWPNTCSSSCQQAFIDCVRQLWGFRLAALQKALPEVLGAVAHQIATDADELEAAEQKPVTSKLKVVGGLGVAAAGGYAVWHFWPQIARFATGLLRRI